jgi:excinuclease ABC subunit A
MSQYKDAFIQNAPRTGFPVHKPYKELNPGQKALLWNGAGSTPGIHAFFEQLEEARYKIQNRIIISRFTGKTVCPVCLGSRLRKEASYVKIHGKRIDELLDMSIGDLYDYLHIFPGRNTSLTLRPGPLRKLMDVCVF